MNEENKEIAILEILKTISGNDRIIINEKLN